MRYYYSMDYLDAGFDSNMLRRQKRDDPTVSQYEFNSNYDGFQADKVQGGIMTSLDGKLVINLNTGEIAYNDGAVDTFNLGGDNGTITIKDTNNNTLLTS